MSRHFRSNGAGHARWLYGTCREPSAEIWNGRRSPARWQSAQRETAEAALVDLQTARDAAAAAGIRAIVQPGGSVRDDEVVAAADEHGIAMVFTGRRHFRH